MRRAGEDVTERYAVREKIGAGGMGVVYRAYDRVRHTDVALKTFRTPMAGDLYRLKKEFRALADLKHPNVVDLYELTVQEDGQCFYTMELVAGIDPRAFCGTEPGPSQAGLGLDEGRVVSGDDATLVSATAGESQWGPDIERVRSVLRGLCRGVAAIHDVGKLHRDLKCGNLLVSDAGEVKILDFGLMMDRHDAQADSFAGKTVGTLAYMSPEQAGGRLDLTPATDWYSVGVILFELLSGDVPFSGSPIRVVVDKQQKSAPSLGDRVPHAPRDLVELCDALLDTAPERRPSAAEIMDALGVEPPRRGAGRFSVTRLTHEDDEAFTGRAAELDALVSDFSEVREGTPVVRVIEGPSGIGKSTLVRAFVRRLRETHSSIVFIEGKCREQERVTYRALDSVIDSLSAIWSRLPRSTAHMIVPRHIASLLHLFPVLGRVPAVTDAPMAPLPKDPRERRNLAYRALRELFERLAAAQTVVLFVDDFQWTDPESHLLLTEVLRPPGAPPMLTLLAARDVDVTAMGPVDTTIAVLGDRLRKTSMGALPPEEMRLLLHRQLPDANPRLVRLVTQQAAGNPFFLTELARYVAFDEGTHQNATLHDAIRARLSHMSEEVQLVTRLVCVSHDPLRADVLRVAARLEAPDVARAVALARSARFIKSGSAEGATGLEPFHDQTRAAVLGGKVGVRELHVRLARAYQSLQITRPRAIARHFDDGGEPELALDAYIAAAVAAEAANDLESAAQLYRVAADLAPQEAQPDLYWRCAEVHSSAGRQLAAARNGELAVASGRESGREQVAVWYGMAGHADKMHDFIPALLKRHGFVVRRSRFATVWGFAWRLALLAILLRRRPRVTRPDKPGPRFALARAAVMSRSRFDYPTSFLFITIEALRVLRDGSNPEVAYWFAFVAQIMRGNGISAHERAFVHAAAAQRGNDEEVHFTGSRALFLMLQGAWETSAEAFRRLRMHELVEDDRSVERRFYERFAIYNLFYRGALLEFCELHDVVLRRTLRMGEVEDAMRLSTGLASAARLVRDQPEQARTDRDRVLAEQGAKGGVQGYYVWSAGILIALYTENVRELEAEVLIAPALKNAAGFSGYYRASHAKLAASAACMSPGESRAHHHYTKRLNRSRLAWARAIGQYHLALLDLYAGREESGRRRLEQAHDQLGACEMQLYANAVKLRLGQLTENQAYIDETYEWAAGQGVVSWAKLARIGAPARPGTFVDRGPSPQCLSRTADIRATVLAKEEVVEVSQRALPVVERGCAK